MEAFCDICGQGYDMRDPAVTLHPGPQWECADESACADRRAAAITANDALAAAVEAALAAHTEVFPGDPS